MSNTKFGVMLDFSRNAVMKISELKKYCDLLKKFGYNAIYLYLEDTYEIEGEEHFGHLRGRYSKAELKEIDAYCKSINMTVIPCFQTLAHLDQIFKWPKYAEINDCDNILLCEEEKTYEFIEKMFKTFKECLSTNIAHIGMDEAFNLGLGKYLQKHGYTNRNEIMSKHLKRVLEIANKYGYECTIWSDMFFHPVSKGVLNLKQVDFNKLDEIKPLIPENVTLCYWDYYNEPEVIYDTYIKMHKYLTDKVCFAGGLWRWQGFAPHNERSIKFTKSAMRACRKNGVSNVFFTSWGDGGSETSFYAILPALLCAVEFYNGNENMPSIKAKFKELTGCDFNAFMKLDKLNTRKHKYDTECKYDIFNDPFIGLFDYCLDGADDYYKKLTKTLKSAGKHAGEYEYVFKSAIALADLLSVKSEIGIKTRKAYIEKDVETLKNIANVVYPKIFRKLEAFLTAFENQWFTENKPFGFDIQHLRIGGLKQRLVYCQKTLKRYIAGEIDVIPELEEPVLPFTSNDKRVGIIQYTAISSPSGPY